MKKLLIGVVLIMSLSPVLGACAGPAGPAGPAGSAGPGLEPKTRTFDIYMWEKKAVGEEPMEEVIPEAPDLLLTEFYHWEPSVLVAFEGDTIVLNVSNPRGTVHSLVIPDFGVDTGPLAPEGGKATVEFVADKAGVFPFMCGTPWDPTTDPEECHPDHKYQTG